LRFRFFVQKAIYSCFLFLIPLPIPIPTSISISISFSASRSASVSVACSLLRYGSGSVAHLYHTAPHRYHLPPI
jgi:hypothetical protein